MIERPLIKTVIPESVRTVPTPVTVQIDIRLAVIIDAVGCIVIAVVVQIPIRNTFTPGIVGTVIPPVIVQIPGSDKDIGTGRIVGRAVKFSVEINIDIWLAEDLIAVCKRLRPVFVDYVAKLRVINAVAAAILVLPEELALRYE